MSKTNRQYKDSVFVDLFANDEKAKERFLDLYNALHGTNLPLSVPVEQLRLDNVMYMSIVNDVSCLVDNKIIVLAEHQSTINENMPLRCLEYIARLYEKVQAPTDRYLRKLSPIPAPEFYVFYNGLEEYPEKTTLKLSDAFAEKQDKPQLELTVTVFNINKGKGAEVLHRCKPLDEYSLFVEEVREQQKLDSENGFTNAVKMCIEKGILKEYLQRKSREVINMLVAEYNYTEDIATQRAEERLIAFSKGIAQGRSEGIAQGFSDGVRETAAAFKKMGIPIAKIAEGTGLTKEEIEKL
ncbi:Rpn family recombination-promoting nuclease/putative transposase [Treponema pedis]|uniref:Rpn family recombination-promoting nuclease/putative transposase n=2 Tax=Treponema pedis TaxID=409322 RepID=UPI003D253607